MNRRNAVKTVLWLFTGMAVMVALSRFTRGLGATTNLTDSTPWGFWIGFDVMAGVALAAGGFVMAALVYIFRIERFRPFVRAAVLTAFLGYLAVAIGLMFDLGLWYNIWHPMVYWQHRSVLFEVATCVILYLNVLALEFAPTALEHKLAQWGPLQKIYKLLKTLTIPLVLLGIMLSTLHQSSLGSLFVIMPLRVHPLWYSPGLMLPLNFFVSAIALGFMMVITEHFVSAWIYKHEPRKELTGSLAGYGAIVLGLYVVLRVSDLFSRGVLPGGLDGSWQSWLFLFELSFSAIIPAAILAVPKNRKRGSMIFLAAVMVVLGMVMYRLDIALITMKKWPGMSYFPSMIEIMVSVGIVSGLGLVFMYFVENLEVFPERMTVGNACDLETCDDRLAACEEGKTPRGVMTGTYELFMQRWFVNWEPFQKAEFSRGTRIWLGDPLNAGVRKYSILLVLGLAATLAALPSEAIFGYKNDPVPVRPAKADVEGKGDVLRVDGNQDKEFVLFNHEKHKERTGGKDGCVECHHMNVPDDFASSCAACHNDMYSQGSAFDHKMHQREFGGNDGCVECHPADKNPVNAKNCQECHQQMWPGASPSQKVNFATLSYKDAMHGNCVSCHEEKAAELGKPELPLCATCHPNPNK